MHVLLCIFLHTSYSSVHSFLVHQKVSLTVLIIHILVWVHYPSYILPVMAPFAVLSEMMQSWFYFLQEQHHIILEEKLAKDTSWHLGQDSQCWGGETESHIANYLGCTIRNQYCCLSASEHLLWLRWAMFQLSSVLQQKLVFRWSEVLTNTATKSKIILKNRELLAFIFTF